MRSFAAQGVAVFAWAVILAGLFLAVLVFFGPSNVGVSGFCDGVAPKWVLDRQGYDGGGCALFFPFDQAPKDADWTPICLGMCLCPEGTLYVGPGKEFTSSDQCTAWPPDQPWPSGLWYDGSDPLEGGTKSWP